VHQRGLQQKIRTNRKGNLIAASKHSNCLGADDTAGVWLALELIKKNVPGTYVFHRDEEIGCGGAQHIVRTRNAWLREFDISIALDRRGTTSLVTAQCGMECCSDEFGAALPKAIGMGHKPDPTGIWTDNVEYLDFIPEIVNLSVGYYGAHTSSEELNPHYLGELSQALAETNFENLPIVRDPSAFAGFSSMNKSYSGTSNHRLMRELVETYPDEIATLLFEFGFDPDDILDNLTKNGENLEVAIWNYEDDDNPWWKW